MTGIPDWVEDLMPQSRSLLPDQPGKVALDPAFEHLFLPPPTVEPNIDTPEGVQAIRALLRPVASSNIAGAGHDGKALYVLFHSGGLYRYRGVHPSLHAQLLGADSPGRFYQARIKGQYEGERLS